MTSYDEGMDAFERRIKRKACPYEEGTDDAEEWLAGRDEAKSLRDDNPLIEGED